MARIIRLILFGTMGFSFSTAAVFCQGTVIRESYAKDSLAVDVSSSSRPNPDPNSLLKSKSKSKADDDKSSLERASLNDVPVASGSESETPSEPVPDLVTSIRSLEVQVLGASPDSESIEDRLIAMEEKLFGKKLTGSLFERLIQIRQAMTAKSSSANAASSAVADVGSKKAVLPPAGPSRAEQLKEAHRLFDDKNYKGARTAMEAFIARNPLVYNGYYLLGLIDLKEHEPLPEYNQFAYNQFLKAYNLAPRSPDCEFVCRYIIQVVRSQRPPDPRSVAVSAKNSPVQALLNIGVSCFLRNDDADARDLFEFIVKYCPGGAASANYNLGAMAEKHGQLQQALALYRTALTASYDRDALVSYKMLERNDVDQLSAKLISRTIQRIGLKIKANDRTWTGNEQEKGSPVSIRCTINRLSPTNIWADIFDAGDNRLQ